MLFLQTSNAGAVVLDAKMPRLLDMLTCCMLVFPCTLMFLRNVAALLHVMVLMKLVAGINDIYPWFAVKKV